MRSPRCPNPLSDSLIVVLIRPEHPPATLLCREMFFFMGSILYGWFQMIRVAFGTAPNGFGARLTTWEKSGVCVEVIARGHAKLSSCLGGRWITSNRVGSRFLVVDDTDHSPRLLPTIGAIRLHMATNTPDASQIRIELLLRQHRSHLLMMHLAKRCTRPPLMGLRITSSVLAVVDNDLGNSPSRQRAMPDEFSNKLAAFDLITRLSPPPVERMEASGLFVFGVRSRSCRVRPQ